MNASPSRQPFYLAPERLRGEPPSPAGDVFSFGLTFFQLWTRHELYEEQSTLQARLPLGLGFKVGVACRPPAIVYAEAADFQNSE